MSEITVLARIELHPGQRKAFLAEFARLMPHVHAEEGCLEYGPTIDAITPITKQTRLGENVVMIVEKWASVAHLEAHLVASHMGPYRERVAGLIASSQLLILEPPAA